MKKGFTLIELLVVIAIIGLLISLILAYLGPARKRARDARRQADFKEINLAMEMCYGDLDCGLGIEQYPATGTAVQNIDTDTKPCYLCPVPDDPSGGDYVWIDNAADTKFYCVYVKLGAPAVDTWAAASHKGTRTDLIFDPSTVGIACW